MSADAANDWHGLPEAEEAFGALDPRFPRHAYLFPSVARECPPGELAHDIWHVTRVYSWALRLANEAGASPDLAGAAALVHDLVPIPKDSPDRAKGGERSAIASAPLLQQAGYSHSEISVIVSAVQTSSWSRGLEPQNPVGVVLQDADRLDAIGALGVMRCIATAQHMSKPERAGRFYAPHDPVALLPRSLDDRRQALDHFRAKLLKLQAGMRLPSAQQEAQKRHAVMEAFMDAVRRELGACSP